MTESTTKTPLDRVAERIEQLGDELKVRAHLAGMEAKDAWDRAHLERIGGELNKLGDEAKVQMHLAGLEAKDALAKLQQKTTELTGKIGASADTVLHDISSGLGDLKRSIREHATKR